MTEISWRTSRCAIFGSARKRHKGMHGRKKGEREETNIKGWDIRSP